MLSFTTDETTELRQLLESAISDLSMEIANTDNPAFKAALRTRRETLRTIHGKLATVDA